MERQLVIVTGQEGVGKSTVVHALLPYLQSGAILDAEEVGQANPWEWDTAFKRLLWDNVAAVAHNFWRAGYTTVVAGSFINDHADYRQFRQRLRGDVKVVVVQLTATKAVRDRRRIERRKPTSEERRDDLDRHFPEDTTLGAAVDDYHYVRIDTSALPVADTVDQIRRALPDAFPLGLSGAQD
jgi:predicted kinase